MKAKWDKECERGNGRRRKGMSGHTRVVMNFKMNHKSAIQQILNHSNNGHNRKIS